MKERLRRAAAGLVLREFYQRHYLPDFLLDRAPATLKIYGYLLDRWERFTSNPALAEIDNETLARFKGFLRDPAGFSGYGSAGRPRRRGSQMTLFDVESAETCPVESPKVTPKRLAAATVGKYLRHLHALLAKAGPPGPGHRDALGIIDTMPWTRPFKERRRLPRDVSDELIEAVYRAAAVAIFPDQTGVKPGDFWKALIVTALTVGFRKAALLSLRWEEIDWKAAEIRCLAEDDKCGSDRVKPVSQVVLKHLLRIRTDAEKVFAFNRSEATFYRQFRRIQDAAGIRPRDRIGLHSLKRACGTRIARIASPWVVQKRLDHSSLATSQFYINASREEKDAIERMPLPSVFEEEFSDTETDTASG